MCFGGGGNSAPAPVAQTPAVPVSDITAGNATVTVQPQTPAQPAASTRTTTPPASQSTGATGLDTSNVRM